MEYCDGGDLQTYLKQRNVVDEPVAVRLLTRLLVALKFIHGQKVSFPIMSSRNKNSATHSDTLLPHTCAGGAP